MAAKLGLMKNSFSVLSSFLPKATATTTNISIQRIPSFYLAARNFSSLSLKQKNAVSLAWSCKKGVCDTWTVFTTRSIASKPGSRFSQIDENEDEEKASNSTDKLKKLTLDDIVLQWPEQKPVWLGYRRNHKGQMPPKRTRLRCTTVSKKLLTQNPCPVCRVRVEKNYELDSKDVVFLSQFLNPHTSEVLDTKQTGVCRQQQKKLINMIEKSKDQGYMPFTIPGPRDPPKKFKPAGIPAPNIRNKTG
ncbi:uncharacterized protein LOC116304154 [Actinia tenebrosa]|uniref:Small ribosomal subunit protein mS40 n=1 Tax=Actinia tenebrosa TaxID=6105 RepID=A0A6P8IRB6_ACTTE|nr:uncharacterized protein LOC116304154 [Actinia tenebrosa]